MALKLQLSKVEDKALDVVVMDASITESHSYSADVTEFPVEKGSAISDNVRKLPDVLNVDAFISDHPLFNEGRIQIPTGAILSRPFFETNRSKNALANLLDWMNEGQTITAETGLRTYTDMVIKSIDVRRDKNVSGGIRFNMVLKKIIVVATQTTELQKAAEAKGQNKVNKGPQTSKEADAPKGSYATKIADSITH